VQIFDHLPVPSLQVKGDGTILRINRLAKELLGADRVRTNSSSLFHLLPRETGGELQKFFSTVKLGVADRWLGRLSLQNGSSPLYRFHISRLPDYTLLVQLEKENRPNPPDEQVDREQFHLLQAQYQRNPAGILLVNDKMQMVSYNKKFARMWGLPKSAQQGRDDRESLQLILNQIKDPAEFMEKIHFLHSHPDRRSTDEVELKDGRVFYRHSCPIRYRGKYLGRVWYFLDITALKAAQNEIVRQKKFQEAILEHIQDGIVACNARGELSIVNRAGRRLHGIEDKDIDTDQWAEHYRLFHADGLSPLQPQDIPLVKALSGQTLRNEEMVIVSADGKRHDVRASGQAMYDDHGNKLGAVVSLHDITDINRTREQLRFMAYHDQLTGLPNRRLFHDLLDQCLRRAQRNREKVAVLFLDLDNFKTVNDCYGHEAGDQLLVQLATILRLCLRDSDILCRWGGDEFVIALGQLSEKEDASKVAEKLCQAVVNHMERHFGECQVSTSIGISLFPEHAAVADNLIRTADQAMYTAKQQGKNRFRYATTANILQQSALPFDSTSG